MPNYSQPKKKTSPNIPGLWERITICLETKKVNDIAAKLGLKPPSVSEWKKHGKPPSLDTLLKICELGNVSLHWLLMDEGPQERQVLKVIKGGQVDYDELNRQAIIDYLLSQSKQLINQNQTDRGMNNRPKPKSSPGKS